MHLGDAMIQNIKPLEIHFTIHSSACLSVMFCSQVTALLHVHHCPREGCVAGHGPRNSVSASHPVHLTVTGKNTTCISKEKITRFLSVTTGLHDFVLPDVSNLYQLRENHCYLGSRLHSSSTNRL